MLTLLKQKLAWLELLALLELELELELGLLELLNSLLRLRKLPEHLQQYVLLSLKY